MRVITVTQSGSGVTGGRRTQVIVSRTGPQGPAGGGAGSVALDDLTDVSLVGTTSGDFLRYNGTAWTDTKIVASDLGTGTADAYHFLDGTLAWVDAVPLDVAVKNTSGGQLTKGTPVYVTGSVGATSVVEVSAAAANSSATMPAIGLLTDTLAQNGTGYARVMGVLTGLSTGAYSVNQTLYVAAAGGLTNTRPTGTTELVQNIGKVMRANNNTGEVLVMGPGRSNDVPNRIGTTYLADGTAGASNYLRGDQTWSTITATDVGAAPTTRNLTASTGLSGGGDLSADRSFSVLYGTTAGTAAEGNDSRLSDARTPTAHKTSHQAGGSDELALSAAQITSGTVATARLGSGTASANTFLRGDQTYQPVPVGNNDMGRVSNAIYLSGTGLSLNGATSGNTATTPDSAALDITGNIEIVVRVALADWTLAQTQILVAKRQTASTRSYGLHVFSGYLYFATSTTGSDVVSSSSSAAVGFSAGQAGWVRVTRNSTTGDVIYYTAADSSSEPSSWTQLGTTQSTTPSSIYNSNSQLEIGSNLNGGSPPTGTIYRAIVRSGIGGTTVFDANFATATADALAFTESSSNAATVTITTTRYSYGVPGVQFNGTGTQALTANTVYYQPFEVTSPLTLDFMALEVTTAAGSNGNLRLGVYAADANLQPTGAPLFDSGDITVTSGATGILSKQGTAVTLQPGVYLTATNSSVALTARTALGGQTMVGTAMGSNLFTVLMSVAQTQGAFPTPGTAWTTRAAATGSARHVVQMRWR